MGGSPAHFFWLIHLHLLHAETAPTFLKIMATPSAIETTVVGLGYELVEVERVAGGLLRVTIDHPFSAATPRFITVDDCERVTRQLQHVLEVEGQAYERLEVSSPGLDRPLKNAADFGRFAGEQVEVTLKVPFKGRKRFRGELLAEGDGWRIVLAPSAAVAAAKKHAASRSAQARAALGGPGPAPEPAADGVKVLDFSLDEVHGARLVPVIDFKGRRFAPAAPSDEVDGGRIQ